MTTQIKPEHRAVLDALGELRQRVEQQFPNKRERSLALTKLQEAGFWLGAAALPEHEKTE